MQRLFANFSGGRPGIGLLVLRAALGLAVCVSTRESWSRAPAILDWSFPASLAWIALLLAGFLTRFTSISCMLVHSCALTLAVTTQPALDALVVMLSIALFLLGPGEYSVDAWLFGRRIVELPRLRSRAKDAIHPDE